MKLKDIDYKEVSVDKKDILIVRFDYEYPVSNENIKSISQTISNIVNKDDRFLNRVIFLPKGFEIESLQPETLLISGLSLFLSDTAKLNVKIVNNEVVLFKAIDQEKNYSESGIINRKSGELVHEITRNVKSENSEKDISFYLCRKKQENA